MSYNHPLIEENRLLCPGCRSANLKPYITERRHQIVLACQQCSRITFLPLRAIDIRRHDADPTITENKSSGA